jgi:hypothetical protein
VTFGLAQRPRLAPVPVRDRRRPSRWRTGALAPVVAGLRGPNSLACVPDPDTPDQLGNRGVGQGVDLGSVSALSESVSKSACSFACTSTTKRVLASSSSSCRFSCSRRAIRSAAGRAAYVRAERPAQPVRRRRGPAATARCGWSTGPPDATTHLLTIGGGVVGGQDLQLVLRGEHPAPGTLGHLRVGTFRSSTTTAHPTSRLRIHFRQFVGDVEWLACAESSSG